MEPMIAQLKPATLDVNGHGGAIQYSEEQATMDKTALRARLLSLEEQELHSTEVAYLDYVATARTQWGEHLDVGDESQAERARFLSDAIYCPLYNHVEKIEILKGIDFGPKCKVEEGAVVTFAGRAFVVAVATSVFACEGRDLMGISIYAPLYAEIAGLRAGEIFSFSGRRVVVEDVF
jgi:hypothetical protein